MFTNLSLLPHESNIVIKDIVQKRTYIHLMQNLLEHFQSALKYFDANMLYGFDAQVGETLCQIRAYKIYLLYNHSPSAFFTELKDLRKKLSIIIRKLVAHNDKYQKLLKQHKNLRPASTRLPITITNFFLDLKCVFSFSENAIFIFISYFLCQYNIIDKNNIPVALNYNKIAELLNLSRSYSKKISHFYQKILSELSCKFIFELLKDLPNHENIKNILQGLNKISDEGRKVLPCYSVTKIILLHMIEKNVHIILVADILTKYEKERIALLLKGSKSLQNFRLIALKEIRVNKSCVVIYGGCITKNVFYKETFLSEIFSIGIKNIILANNAAHPQYSGNLLKAFNDDPFKKLAQERQNNLSSFEISLIGNLSNEFLRMKKLAGKIGCTINNQSLFYIQHIFCNSINAYSEYFIPALFSINKNVINKEEFVV